MIINMNSNFAKINESVGAKVRPADVGRGVTVVLYHLLASRVGLFHQVLMHHHFRLQLFLLCVSFLVPIQGFQAMP